MSRPPYRGIIINSQKSLALNDFRLVRLIKSKKRIILCEILLRLGAAVSCKNQFQKTPVEIARCWNRQDLAKFLGGRSIYISPCYFAKVLVNF